MALCELVEAPLVLLKALYVTVVMGLLYTGSVDHAVTFLVKPFKGVTQYHSISDIDIVYIIRWDKNCTYIHVYIATHLYTFVCRLFHIFGHFLSFLCPLWVDVSVNHSSDWVRGVYDGVRNLVTIIMT